MANSKIVTGQYVALEQTPASLIDRVMARLIDYFCMVAYVVAMFAIVAFYEWERSITENGFALMMMVLFLPVLLYDLLFEVLHHGQTIGKTAMKIQVVNEDGTPPTLSSYLLRFLLVPIDVGMFGLGLVFVVLSRKSQRLGDLAAGTMVVKTRPSAVYLPDFSYAMQGYVPTYSEAADLSLNQVQLISRVLYYTKADRNDLINCLSLKIQMHYGIVPSAGSQEQFLMTLLNDYSYYCSTIEA